MRDRPEAWLGRGEPAHARGGGAGSWVNWSMRRTEGRGLGGAGEGVGRCQAAGRGWRMRRADGCGLGGANACAERWGGVGWGWRMRRPKADWCAGAVGACAVGKTREGGAAHVRYRGGGGEWLRMRSAMRSAARLMAAAVGTGTAAGSGPKRLRPEPAPAPRIGTHDGTFHCDEVLACYLLRLLPCYRVRPRATVRRDRDCGLLGPTCYRAGSLPGPLQRDRDTVHCPDPCPPSRPESILGAALKCPVPPGGSPLPGGTSRCVPVAPGDHPSALQSYLEVPGPTQGPPLSPKSPVGVPSRTQGPPFGSPVPPGGHP